MECIESCVENLYVMFIFLFYFPAMTAYNPAIVALNNMLREQIRLVEQFVEINQRMYESYSTGINSNYRYTTLEDTQQVSRKPNFEIHV